MCTKSFERVQIVDLLPYSILRPTFAQFNVSEIGFRLTFDGVLKSMSKTLIVWLKRVAAALVMES